MRQLVLGLILTLCGWSSLSGLGAESPATPEEPLRVLFFGSSYTYYHDLPGVLRQLAATAQSPLLIEEGMVAHPGYNLEGHWRDEQQRDAISSRSWDVLILQEQSQRPLRHRESMYESALGLVEKGRTQGAKAVLFMTWAPLRRQGMIRILAEAYEDVGARLGVPVAPVGLAWQKALELRPELRLHSPDGSHPGPKGTYLTACVLYASLTGDDVRQLGDVELPQAATAEELAFLRQVAFDVVTEQKVTGLEELGREPAASPHMPPSATVP